MPWTYEMFFYICSTVCVAFWVLGEIKRYTNGPWFEFRIKLNVM
jgi:hypothetical protein